MNQCAPNCSFALPQRLTFASLGYGIISAGPICTQKASFQLVPLSGSRKRPFFLCLGLLLTLQAKAPGANVIVIGTHLDELRKRAGGAKQVETLLRQYEEQITQEYFPTSKTSPVIRSINFVAVPDRFFGATNIDTLVESIYDVASDMEVPRSEPHTLYFFILSRIMPSYVCSSFFSSLFIDICCFSLIHLCTYM